MVQSELRLVRLARERAHCRVARHPGATRIAIGTLTCPMGPDRMTVMGVYDRSKKAFRDIIAPELHALRGDIGLVDRKIDAVDARLTVKVDAVRNEMIAEIRRVDTRIEGVDRESRTAIDLRERLAALEARHPA